MYVPIQAEEIPKAELGDGRGSIKVVNGEYGTLASKIPNYSRQFIYHIKLEPGKQFSFPTEAGLEYAAFLPLQNATINDAKYRAGDLVIFDTDEGDIEFRNSSKEVIDIIIFGGTPYTEPIVFGGPFVMNSELEIAQAYEDFYAGKYGKIDYQQEVK